MKLPEVSEIRNMLRARANSHLLVVELCRTSSTSSPAEKERSTAHDKRGYYGMGYLKPSW